MLAEGKANGIEISIPWVSAKLSLPLWQIDRFTGNLLRGLLVRNEISKFKPDLVHALELQNAGYSTAVAYRGLAKHKRPKLLITNYGSEIVWFRKLPAHLKKLKELMGLADAFSAECGRDARLAREIGFAGQVMETIPVSGGVKLDSSLLVDQELDQRRKTIVIKGYQNVWGQAIVALRAIESLADELSNYRIELFSCNQKTIQAASELRKKTNLEVITHKKHSLSHVQVLEIMKGSLAYIGLSTSDGISTSMIEAMSQGAIPIQSNTSCGNEWLTNGEDGFLVEYQDWEAVAKHLLFVLNNPSFVAKARTKNYQTIRERYDSDRLSEIANGYYEKLLG
jgi:glycosyltransferase involved in cell wall biosynthesis